MDTVWARTAARVASLTGRRCVIRVPENGGWRVVAGGDTWDPAVLQGALRIPVDGGSDRQAEVVLLPQLPGGSAADPLDCALARGLIGDAVESAVQLDLVSSSLEAVRSREKRRDAFVRALVLQTDRGALHSLIVETMARVVGAEIGAFAVPLAGEQALGVTATFGYPSAVVEHVRQAPGEGILGRVYATGQAVVVRDVADVPDHARRRRYRSRSYLAFPISGAEGVLAVVAVTDRADARPFDNADLMLLTSFAAPASLALAREMLRERTRELGHLATVDGLTALFNRRYFEMRLEQEIQRQRRQQDELALLMIDLDNFKSLNDSQGHLVGDRVLREVADILRRAVRIFDVCGRYGGEEFAILMPGANAPTALRVAERIRRQVEQHFASGLRSGAAICPTVSLGVATATPATTRETLIAHADAALFQAKREGKNAVCLHPPAVA
jgi:diguanylate cyclase (GGDEF)-like protein